MDLPSKAHDARAMHPISVSGSQKTGGARLPGFDRPD